MITPVSVDRTDLILLDFLQDDIPLEPNPWQILAQKVGLSEDETLARIQVLADKGVLRGIAPTLESGAIHPMVSTLVAFRVPDGDIERVAAVVNQYSEVSHNFRRNHLYNLWFTLAASSHERINEVIREICSLTGVQSNDVLNLFTEKKYKINVRFPLLSKISESGGDSFEHR